MQIRFIIVILMAINVLINYADRANVSVLIMEIKKEFSYLQNEWNQSLVFGSFYVGYILSQVLSGFLSDKFGGKYVLAFGCFLWSTSEVIFPYGASKLKIFIILRVCLGLGEGLVFPAIHSILSKILPPKEKAPSAAIILSFGHMGTILSLLVTSKFIGCWRCVFVGCGIVGFVWLVPWIVFSASSPETSIWMSNDEKSVIGCNAKSAQSENKRAKKLNLLQIFSSKAMWAIIIANYCSGYLFYLQLNFLPIYLHERYGYKSEVAAKLVIIPYLMLLLLSLVLGKINSRISSKNKKKWMQIIGMIAGIVCVTITIFIPDKYKHLSIIFHFTAASTYAFGMYGSHVSHFDLSPGSAGLLYAIGNTFTNIAGLSSVLISGMLLRMGYEWNWVFGVAVCHLVFGVLVWGTFSSSKPDVEEKDDSGIKVPGEL